MSIAELRRAALAEGRSTFSTGVPCVRGHTCDRWTINSICVECKRENDKAYNARNPEAHLRRARESAARRPEEVKEYRRQYYVEHREEAKRRARQWELDNPERARERARRWYAATKAERRKKGREWVEKNRVRVRAAGRRWKRANPHKVREADARRRAKEVGAVTGSREARAAYASFVKWARTAGRIRCYWCKKPTKRGHRHLDHIIALARGGADAVENLCVACPACNTKKGAKLPHEFAGQAELELAPAARAA